MSGAEEPGAGLLCVCGEGYVIIGYTGKLGSGKTYCMVHDALRSNGACPRPVYTDMASLCWPEAVYLDPSNARMVADVAEGLLLLDEAQLVADARAWQQVPPEFLSALSQLRKRGLDLAYTTQLEGSVEARLRGLTTEYVRCRRVRSLFVLVHYEPGAKHGHRRRLVRFKPEVASVYDSWEVLGRLHQSPVPRSRYLGGDRRDDRAALDAPGGAPIYAGYDGRYRLTWQARSALQWLVFEGMLPREWLQARDGAELWVPVVRREVERRAWLAVYGLSHRDVARTCWAGHPWLAGWSPRDVLRRAADRAVDEAESRQARLRGGVKCAGLA